jgi:prepilin-type N-terminal cleavage/methylation domain-containing protein
MNRPMTAKSVARSAGASFGAGALSASDPASHDEGFTLAEVIVSIALFTIMSVAATTSLVTVVKLTNRNENRVLATNLAVQQIENLRLANTTAAAVLDEGSHDVQLKSKTFTVTTTLLPGAATTCTAGSSRRTTVTVWTAGRQLVRYDAVLAC